MSTEAKTLEPGAELRPASWKQTRYLRTLVNDREVDFTIPPKMTEAKASELIDLAKTFPRRIPELVEPGFYTLDGELYRVRARQTGPGTYAELYRVKDGRASWKYTPGAVTSLRGKQDITTEEAEAMMRDEG